MENDILHVAALKVHEQYLQNEGLPPTAIDLGGLLEWGQIIFNLLAKCQEKKAAGLIAAAKNPGLLQRVAANNAVRSVIDAPRRVIVAKAQALLDACAESNPASVQELLNAIDS